MIYWSSNKEEGYGSNGGVVYEYPQEGDAFPLPWLGVPHHYEAIPWHLGMEALHMRYKQYLEAFWPKASVIDLWMGDEFLVMYENPFYGEKVIIERFWEA